MTATTPGIGHNQPPSPFDIVSTLINDLYDEAKNFADGEPISDQPTHDAIESLHQQLHEAGKQADEARKEEKRPLDEEIAKIQDRYAPLISDTKKVKGKVVLGKEALAALLLPWRRKVDEEKRAVAAAAAAEAERLAALAREAMATSQGNLAAREDAELLVNEAAAVGRFAVASTKGPTGLRSVWTATLEDQEAALDWAFQRTPEEFLAIAQSHADAVVRAGMRSVPGFRVWEDKAVRV